MGGVGSGGSRRPSGRSLEFLKLSGSFRADRHAARQQTATAPLVKDVDVPAHLIRGLKAGGRKFVTGTYAEFDDWSTPQLTLLREAGKLVDVIARLDGDDTLLRRRLLAHRALLATISALGLKG